MLGFIENSGILIPALPGLFWYIVLVEVYEENLYFCSVVGKGRSILIAFLDNDG